MIIVCVALQQEMFSILTSIVNWTHRVYGVTKVMIEFVRVQITEAYAKRVRKAIPLDHEYHTQVSGQGGLGKSLFLNELPVDDFLISAARLFHSFKQLG